MRVCFFWMCVLQRARALRTSARSITQQQEARIGANQRRLSLTRTTVRSFWCLSACRRKPSSPPRASTSRSSRRRSACVSEFIACWRVVVGCANDRLGCCVCAQGATMGRVRGEGALLLKRWKRVFVFLGATAQAPGARQRALTVSSYTGIESTLAAARTRWRRRWRRRAPAAKKASAAGAHAHWRWRW